MRDYFSVGGTYPHVPHFPLNFPLVSNIVNDFYEMKESLEYYADKNRFSENFVKIHDALMANFTFDTDGSEAFALDLLERKITCQLDNYDIYKLLNVVPVFKEDPTPDDETHYFPIHDKTLHLLAMVLSLPECPRLGTLYFDLYEPEPQEFFDEWRAGSGETRTLDIFHMIMQSLTNESIQAVSALDVASLLHPVEHWSRSAPFGSRFPQTLNSQRWG